MIGDCHAFPCRLGHSCLDLVVLAAESIMDVYLFLSSIVGYLRARAAGRDEIALARNVFHSGGLSAIVNARLREGWRIPRGILQLKIACVALLFLLIYLSVHSHHRSNPPKKEQSRRHSSLDPKCPTTTPQSPLPIKSLAQQLYLVRSLTIPNHPST